jgi:hypothetical protein
MNEHEARAVAALEREYPTWQIWTVETWSGLQRGTVFCARRWDGAGQVLNADTAGELRRYLEAEAGRR